jgi:hypothetical protein
MTRRARARAVNVAAVKRTWRGLRADKLARLLVSSTDHGAGRPQGRRRYRSLGTTHAKLAVASLACRRRVLHASAPVAFGSNWLLQDRLSHVTVAAVTASLNHDSLALEGVHASPPAKGGKELLERQHHRRVGGATGAVSDLAGVIVFEKENAARPERASEAWLQFGANWRRQVRPRRRPRPTDPPPPSSAQRRARPRVAPPWRAPRPSCRHR